MLSLILVPSLTVSSWLPRFPGGQAGQGNWYAGVVTQLHVDLPPEVSERVPDEAARRGVAPDELVIEVVAQRFSPPRPLDIVGLGASGRSDISEHVDEEIASILVR